MAVSQFAELWDRLDDLEAGLFRTPVGPGGIRNKMIRPKSITSGLIEVSSLQAVQSKTGSLSVTGGITMTTAGSFSAGQTAYDTGIGWWLDYNAGTPRLSLGNSGGSKLTWNGTTLAITGTITATSGTIGGWTIGTTDLQGSGGVIGLASSGSIRIWSGSATPSAAPFQVDSLGNLTATAGAIGGWTISGLTGLVLGTGASTRGISTGATAFYAGSATPSLAPFSVDQAGGAKMSNLTITGGSINLNGGVFSVSSLGAVTASNISVTGGSITGGTITASLINAGTLTFNAGGTLNGGGAALSGTLGNSAGTLNLGKLTITDQLTLGVGAKIVDADGSFWDQNGLILKSATGSNTDVLIFQDNLGTARGYVYPTATQFVIDTNNRNLLLSSGATGSAFLQSGSGGDVTITIGDSAGTNQFKVRNLAGTQMFGVNSSGDLVRPIANDATALGAYFGRVPIYINGTLKYLAVYS